MRDQEIIGLYEAYHQVYALQELTEEVEIAAQYFYEMGLNEDGVDILIEDLGVEEFADWVYEIAEDYTLTEARAGGSRIEPVTAKGQKFKSGKPTGKSLERLRAQKAARREAENKASESKPSGLKSSLQRQSAVVNAQKKQPEKSGSPKGIAGRIGAALGGAVKRAKSDIELTKKTAQTVGKAVGTGIEALNRASDTTLARQGRVATHKGVKRHTQALSAAGGALGRLAAKSPTVRDTFKAGQKLGNALRREEVEEWVNALVEEGYDLSEYTWEDMTEMYLNEGRNTSLQALAREKQQRQNPKGKYDRDKALMMGHNKPSAYKYKKDPETGRWSNEGRRDGATESELRTKVSQRSLRNRRGGVDAVPKKNGRPMFESTEDLFDYLLEYLVVEGYADTNKAALAIMANMSEEWKQSIVEMGENIGKEPKTVGGPERPGVGGETYDNRAERIKPKGWKPTGPKLKSGQRPGYAR